MFLKSVLFVKIMFFNSQESTLWTILVLYANVTAKLSSFSYYNEFGSKKRCYSSLHSLKIGKFDNFENIIERNLIDKIPKFSYNK